jgi:predicted pyridoxine 5'-phosphate oxidase superfamily flavin-nucleotide-binding protein
MADQFDGLQSKHIEFIQRQQLFFVGTAAAEGFVNVSPKGMDSFRVIDEQRIVWLNLTGSGNESAAHLLENSRMTVMFCSFDRQPLILRLYGTATTIHPRDREWQSLAAMFPDHPGARQVFDMKVDMVQTSCGYAVPFYTLAGERPTLTKWAEKKGEAGIQDYWVDTNQRSLDDKDTGILSG